MIFASHLGISVSSVREKAQVFIGLIPEGTHFVPRLVYLLMSKHGDFYIDYHVAWIDAHTGRLLRVFVEG